MIIPDPNLYYFDEEAADHFIRFVEAIIVYPVGGISWEVAQPFRLEQWQIDEFRYIFGWKCKADGSRMVRDWFVTMAKKNGKTISAIIISIYLLLYGEIGEKIRHIASSQKQALEGFALARDIILQSPRLKPLVASGAIKVLKTQITVPSRNSSYEVMTASPKSAAGPNISCLICDEMALWTFANELAPEIRKAGRVRKQPLRIYASTGGQSREHYYYFLYEYACKVRDGKIDNPQFKPLIFETGPDDPIESIETAKKANPNFHLFNQIEWQNDLRQALENPVEENKFRQLSLNQWVNSSVAWLPYEAIDKCKSNETVKDLYERLKGKTVWAALDLAPVSDTSALVLVSRDDDGIWDCLPFVFLPTDNAIAREKLDRVPYPTWASKGFIKLSPGETTDWNWLYNEILTILKDFDVKEVAYDNHYIGPIAQKLENEGYTTVLIGQNYNGISPGLNAVENLIRSNRIRLPIQPVLDWMFSNVYVRTNAGGQRMPDKRQRLKRIDAVLALIMAITRGTVEHPIEEILSTESFTMF